MKRSIFMKKVLRIIIPVLLSILIVVSLFWYAFVYDRDMTRDMLLKSARHFFNNGRPNVASWFYDLAYQYAGQDENVAIELANQFKLDGNYTKAEFTLSNAIADGGGTVDLYTALCKTYVEQDKILDAVAMLDNVSDPEIKSQLDSMRPSIPTSDPAPGFYSKYISVSIANTGGTLYYTANGEYPSVKDEPYAGPITLPGGETTIHAVCVGENGLVSPMSIMGYTVGGVIEEVTFADPVIEADIRAILGVAENEPVYTDELWTITGYTVPENATNFDDLSKLTLLQKLTIHDQQLDSLKFLTSMSDLTRLDLSGCSFNTNDLALIGALPNLEELTLANCGISTIAGLSNAPKLTYLDVSNNTVRNLEALSSVPTLQEVYLQHNAVIDLSALTTLTELTKLNVSYNALASIAPLSSCANLTWLDVSHNALPALERVNELTQLAYLSAEGNSLTDVSTLSSNTALAELNISHNSLTDISALSALTNLISLDFSYNEVSSLPAWADGSAMQTISGSYNQVSDLSGLRNLKNLAYVTMDYNKITSIGALADCYKLIQVSIHGNSVADVNKLTSKGIIVNYTPV